MDRLSDIVSRLKISSQKIVTFDMAANTNAQFPDYSGMKIYIAKSGSFFIKWRAVKTVMHLRKGIY